MWANLQRIIVLFTQKLVKLSKIWVWDPVSEIREQPVLDPGSRGSKGTILDPRTGSATLYRSVADV
jgi:hypothetical protein